VQSLTKQLVSAINIWGVFAVLFALSGLRKRRKLWLKSAMLLILSLSFLFYYFSAPTGPANDQQLAVKWYWGGLLCRLICAALGTYGIILARKPHPGYAPAAPPSTTTSA